MLSLYIYIKIPLLIIPRTMRADSFLQTRLSHYFAVAYSARPERINKNEIPIESLELPRAAQYNQSSFSTTGGKKV